MKIEKLFKKIDDFFSLNEKEKSKKSKKLDSLLEKKIDSMKNKIKNSTNESKKNILVQELKILKEIKKKL